MTKAIGIIGDIHGIPDELESEIAWLNSQGISNENIWCLGDLVDRGPDSGAVVHMVRKLGINSVLGNHEQSILNRWKYKVEGEPPGQSQKAKAFNPDKEKTLSQLTVEDIEWMSKLPKLHVIDDLQLILVHGGLWPNIPLHAQPYNVIRAQMIHTEQPGRVRWWGAKAKEGSKFSEEESYTAGWRRWYELYDFKYDCAYGHSVFQSPYIHKNPGCGTTFGLDTGGVFGGWLTSMIHDGPGNFHIHQTQAKQMYVKDMLKQFIRE